MGAIRIEVEELRQQSVSPRPENAATGISDEASSLSPRMVLDLNSPHNHEVEASAHSPEAKAEEMAKKDT